MTCNLQEISAWKLARLFFHPHCHTILQGLVTSIRPLVVEFIQRHMLRINFGLTWPLDLVGRLHGMADLDSRKLTWMLTSPPPQPSDLTWDVHVTQVNMNVNIPTPQPSDVTWDVNVTNEICVFSKTAKTLVRFSPRWHKHVLLL